jgi:hypothetical protein
MPKKVLPKEGAWTLNVTGVVEFRKSATSETKYNQQKRCIQWMRDICKTS